MKDFLIAIAFLIVVVSTSLFFGNVFLVTRPQVQEGFDSVGKMFTALEVRVKALEDKK